MGLFQRVSDAVSGRATTRAVKQELSNLIHVNPQCSTAENVFAQALPLIDEMTSVFPYGVGRNGARLADNRTPELMLLKSPNEDMGWAEFANLMFMAWLTERELNIHVHKNGRGRVLGYSVLPPCSKISLGNGDYYYQVYTTDGIEQLSRDEVMTLRFMRSPINPSKGISPAGSVFTYTQIDDVTAQYIRAYFENGAVPASITFIKASTRERYENARRELESKLHGAANKNKTIYVWRQMLDDGREADQIEVKTIQGNNSTLALKEISDIVNTRINKAFGVSNFILGDDASAKYDNAELSDRQFTKRRVYPALTKFWSQFQHELDRITGGLGYAIQFDLEIPELTDRLKTKAEIAEKNVANLIRLIEAGASPTSAVNALELGKSWMNVANGVYGRELEVREYEKIQAETPVLLEAKNEEPKPAEQTQDEHGCSCHHSEDAFTGKFGKNEQVEKKIYNKLVALAEEIVEESKDLRYEVVISEISALLEGEANKGGALAVDQVTKVGDKALKTAINERLAEKGYKISSSFSNRLKTRTDRLVRGYSEYTQGVISRVLDENQDLTEGEIKKMLMEALPKHRAELIARNETIYAFRSGQLDVDKQLADEYDLEMTLVWNTSKDGDVCEVCAAMEGERTSLGEAFADTAKDKDGNVVAWEHTSWNDYGQVPDAHPNCRCYYTVEVERK